MQCSYAFRYTGGVNLQNTTVPVSMVSIEAKASETMMHDSLASRPYEFSFLGLITIAPVNLIPRNYSLDKFHENPAIVNRDFGTWIIFR